jgi:hypothetical protein
MAHNTLYVNPQSELVPYTFDFADDLTGDTTLYDIGSGSTITAYNSAGTDVSSTILSSKTRTSMTLAVKIGAVTDFEEYRIEFVGKGFTTANIFTKVLEVRARKLIQGGF